MTKAPDFAGLPDKPKAKGKQIMIDMTPTWSGILPLLLNSITDGSTTAQRNARIELGRMAKLADAYVELSKKKPG